jgi:NADH-quinone oxidoreductase subunit H
MNPVAVSILAGVVKIAIVVGFVVNISAILTWLERRQMAMIQDRIGPHRANIKIFGKEIRLAGLLHPLADGIKFFFKEDFVPPNADKLLHGLAPILSLFPPIVLLGVVPFMDTLCPQVLKDHGFWASVPRFGECASGTTLKALPPISGQVVDINVGLLYVFAFAGMGVIGATIAGWSSDNKFSLLGGLRAASQLVSYEVGMGLSLVGVLMVYSTLQLGEMARWQGENVWGIFVQPLGFLLFFTAAAAESKRTPFDLPEGESEIVAGYLVEYSGMKFGMFYMGEYIEVAVVSGLLTALYLGGYNVPFLYRDGIDLTIFGTTLVKQTLPHVVVIAIQVLTFFGKVTFLCWFQIFIRWTLPRFRYDQLMKLGWRMLLPACLVNVFITGVAILAYDRAGANVKGGLALVGDALNAVTLLAMLAFPIWVVVGLLTPSRFASRRAEVAKRLAARAPSPATTTETAPA